MLKEELKVANKNADKKPYVIVRNEFNEVYAGFIDRDWKPHEIVLYNARQLVDWKGSNNLLHLAINGTMASELCEFSKEVPAMILYNVSIILFTTEAGQKSIQNVSAHDTWS